MSCHQDGKMKRVMAMISLWVNLCVVIQYQCNAFNMPGSIHSNTPTTHHHATSRLFMVSEEVEKLNLTPELAKMTEAFASIPDEKMRYKQLLYMAGQLEPMDRSLMVPENKVPGCLSTVYVDCTAESQCNENGEDEVVLKYVGDSDGVLTKGLVALLIRGLSGCTPDQIQQIDPEFINVAKITQSLTPGRNNGFLNMIKVMKQKAQDVSESYHDEPTSQEDSELPEVITSFDEIEGKPMYNAIMNTVIKLQPVKVELKDDSDQHAGHAGSKGWEESGESHFSLTIVADAFSGLPLVKRHQLIYMLLGDTMNKIHALQISAKTPDEI